MHTALLLIGLGTFVATFLGGLLAISFRDKLHLVLGLSAGAIIGVAFFDLLPESLELARDSYSSNVVTAVVALGFVVYLLLDRFFVLHGHSDGDDECENEHHKIFFGAGSLALHSFLDGIAIGLSYQVSTAVGLVVTFAVLVHDVSDGLNTVSVVLRRGGTKRSALKWLSLDALAPVFGIFATFLFSFQESQLALLLALFCGFFLYIGASDLLPESHHRHPTLWTTIATVLGIAIMYGVIQIAPL